jgi:hypothetical protein
VKDIDRFNYDLERDDRPAALRVVNEGDLERDAQSFMAFASAFGVKPPAPGGPTLESADAVSEG